MLLFTSDTGEFYKGTGSGLIKYSDVVFVENLPAAGLSGKMYLKIDALNNAELFVYNNGWVTVSSGGGGLGDMLKSVYDTNNNETDFFDYADGKMAKPATLTADSLLMMDGVATGWTWVDRSVDLMTETMVFGSASKNQGAIYSTGLEITRLPLFAFKPSLTVVSGVNYWVRDIWTPFEFCNITISGTSSRSEASTWRGVRPIFSIKGI